MTLEAIQQRLREVYREERQASEAKAQERQLSLWLAYPDLEQLERERSACQLEMLSVDLQGLEDRKKVLAQNLEELEQKKLDLLGRLGVEADYASPRYTCERCQDSGVSGEGLCPDCYERRFSELLDEVFEGHSFEQFKPELFSDEQVEGAQLSPRAQILKLKERFEHYAQVYPQEKLSLFFSGQPGTGKTYMAHCLVRRLMERGLSARMEAAPALFEAYARYHLLCKTYTLDQARLARLDSYLSRVRDADFLLIDDLGLEVSYAEQLNDLMILLEHRRRQGLPTLVTSNLSPKRLMEVYDERLLSRLRAQFKFYAFIGDDLRGKLRGHQRAD